MREYKLVLIFRNSLSGEKRKKLLDTVKGWLKLAKITKEDAWGQKALSYVLKREQSGFYHLLSFEAKESIPSDLEKRIQGQDDILRHLLLRLK